MQSHRKQKDIITLQINPRKTRWIFNLFEDLTEKKKIIKEEMVIKENEEKIKIDKEKKAKKSRNGKIIKYKIFEK